MRFAELAYRDCGYCRTVSVAMTAQWSDRTIVDAKGERHYWATYACPRCGNVTLVEMAMINDYSGGSIDIAEESEVAATRVLPSADDFGIAVKHLPEDVEGFFGDAQRALLAGLPDAAAVQLRKTLEASAAKKGIEEKNLFTAVKKLLEGNYITQDFAGLLDHIRQIGNQGAHYTDVQLTSAEVERSLRFTTQVLRNLFEVPGELAELEAEAAAAAASEAAVEPEVTTYIIGSQRHA